MAVVAAGGDALGGDALLLGADRGLRQLEQVPADRLLGAVSSPTISTSAAPRIGRASVVCSARSCVDTELRRPRLQRARAAVGQLLARDAGRGVVADVLRERDRHARLGVDLDDRLGEVGGRHRSTPVKSRRGLDLVAVAARQGHPAVRAAVAEDDIAAVRVRSWSCWSRAARGPAGRTGGPGAGRVRSRLAERSAGDVVLVLAVLAVEQLRRDHDRRRSRRAA